MKKLLSRKITRHNIDKFLESHTTRGKTLDIGCGKSSYTKYFPNRVGIDVVYNEGVDIVGDVHNLPFEDDTFDVILCTEVLEHLMQPQRAIDEMRRVLKPKGKLILTTRFIFPLHEIPHDYYRFTKYGLEYLLKDWSLLEIRAETDTIGTISVLFQRIGFQCDILNLKILRGVFLIIAHLTKHFGFLIKREYGDIGRRSIEKNILTSGYYVVAVKSRGNR